MALYYAAHVISAGTAVFVMGELNCAQTYLKIDQILYFRLFDLSVMDSV